MGGAHLYNHVPPRATNYGMLAGNGKMPPNWEVEHYLYVKYPDGTVSDTLTYTPDSCIAGCIDSTEEEFNQWANEDDGSCSTTLCDTQPNIQLRWKSH